MACSHSESFFLETPGHLLQVMPGGNTRTSLFAAPFPVTLAHGRAARVWDLDGHEYVDGEDQGNLKAMDPDTFECGNSQLACGKLP